MIPRTLHDDLQDALKRQAAVAIVGLRQSGKTTLAREVGDQREAVYLDLEDRDDRNRWANRCCSSTTSTSGS